MLYFSKIKTTLIWLVCAMGIVVSLPNLVEPEATPDWLPRFHLGLDLQGGAYLLLEVETDQVVRERLDTTIDGVRTALRGAGVGYRGLGDAGDAVTFSLTDPAAAAAARAVIRPLLAGGPTGPDDFTVSSPAPDQDPSDPDRGRQPNPSHAGGRAIGRDRAAADRPDRGQ